MIICSSEIQKNKALKQGQSGTFCPHIWLYVFQSNRTQINVQLEFREVIPATESTPESYNVQATDRIDIDVTNPSQRDWLAIHEQVQNWLSLPNTYNIPTNQTTIQL